MTEQGGWTMAAPERQDYIPTPGVIKEVRRLTSLEKFFKIGLPEGRELEYRPGQFVQVSVIMSVGTPAPLITHVSSTFLAGKSSTDEDAIDVKFGHMIGKNHYVMLPTAHVCRV